MLYKQEQVKTYRIDKCDVVIGVNDKPLDHDDSLIVLSTFVISLDKTCLFDV